MDTSIASTEVIRNKVRLAYSRIYLDISRYIENIAK